MLGCAHRSLYSSGRKRNVDGIGAEGNIGDRLALRNVIYNCTNFGTDVGDDPLAAVGVTAVDPQLDVNYAATDVAATNAPLDIAGFKAAYPSSVADEAFFDATDYVGAVDPNGAAPFWYEGWTIEGSL